MDYSQYSLGNGAAMAAQFNAEQLDYQGVQNFNPNTTSETFYNPQDPETLRKKAQLEQLKQNGVPFTAPSNGRMLFDMLGSMLVSYGYMRLFGAEGNEALGVGLSAAGIAHDKDKQEIDRYGILQGAINKNGDIYSPEILWQFMKSGDGKAMEQVERDHFNSGETDKRFAHEDTSREDTQTFQAGEQADRLAQQKELHGETLAMQQARLDKMGNGRGSAMSLVDDEGYLTGHGSTAAQNLANIVWREKASFIKPLQTRMSKLSSAEGMAPQIEDAIKRGDYKTAQQLFTTYKSDLAQANKGGNASIGEEDKKELDAIGSVLNQWENKARSVAGYLPEEGTMNALFNSMNAVNSNDYNALNREIRDAAGLNIRHERPEVVEAAADILLKGQVGQNTPVTGGTPINTGADFTTTQPLGSYIGTSTTKPEGYTASNGKTMVISHNGKWELQE